jgi:hypothetical protein
MLIFLIRLTVNSFLVSILLAVYIKSPFTMKICFPIELNCMLNIILQYWSTVYYHELSWVILNQHELSWIILNYPEFRLITLCPLYLLSCRYKKPLLDCNLRYTRQCP